MQTILERKISILTGKNTFISVQGTQVLVTLQDTGHLFVLENDLIKIPVCNTFDISDLELKLKIAKAIQSHITFKNIDERKVNYSQWSKRNCSTRFQT